MSDLKIIETLDGSHSLYSTKLNETYHSTFGAITESESVYIENGFRNKITKKQTIYILETGMGTGLNVFMTFLEAQKNKQKVYIISYD